MREIQLIMKRLIDIFGSLSGLVILLPVFLCISIAIKITSKGSVFFCQERLGKDAVIFTLYKFRTMIPGAIHMGAGSITYEKDPRITPVGEILRKFSLDELPQLFNVLKGDISLVGPRPALPLHVDYYRDFERRRLRVRPGITSLATIRGRASIPWSQRIKYDIEYVDNFNLLLDIKILFRTVAVVLRREGIYYNREKPDAAFDLWKESPVNLSTADLNSSNCPNLNTLERQSRKDY